MRCLRHINTCNVHLSILRCNSSSRNGVEQNELHTERTFSGALHGALSTAMPDRIIIRSKHLFSSNFYGYAKLFIWRRLDETVQGWPKEHTFPICIVLIATILCVAEDKLYFEICIIAQIALIYGEQRACDGLSHTAHSHTECTTNATKINTTIQFEMV